MTARTDPHIVAAVERMEALAADFMRTMVAELADLHELVDGSPDPLEQVRGANGHVYWTLTYADEVRVGWWVQACHGDPDWHQVEDVTVLCRAAIDTAPSCRITYDGTAHDWAPRDALRVAVHPMRGAPAGTLGPTP